MKRLVALLLFPWGLAFAASPLDAPLHIRNTGPLMGLYGLPRAQGGNVQEDGLRWLMSVDYGNTFSSTQRGTDLVALDGESMTSAITLSGSFAPGWEWGVELPYVSHRRSNLDSFIDSWHNTFGLPDGGRDRAARGLLNYTVRIDGVQHVNMTEPVGGIGDVRLWVGRALYQSERRAGALRLQVKAPTGDAAKLTGSEAWDTALWWEHDEQALFGLPRLGLSASLGAAYLGEGEFLPRQQNTVVGLASLGLRFRLTDRVALNLQADAHGAPISTEFGELDDDGVQGTIGGRILITPRLWVDLGVVENLESASSPDAVFLLHLGGRW